MLDAATVDFVSAHTRAAEPRVVARRQSAVRRAIATMEMREGAGRLREVITIQTVAAPPFGPAWITGALRYVPPAKPGTHGRIEFKSKRERKGVMGYRGTPAGVWRDALAIDDAWSLGEVEAGLEELMREHLRQASGIGDQASGISLSEPRAQARGHGGGA